MRIVRIVGYAFMALVLAGGWGFLYWQSSSVDLSAVEAARAALGELRAVDAGWNQRLVATRLQPEAASAAPARFRTAYATVEVRALRLADPRVGSALPQLRRAFEEKSGAVERQAAAVAELRRPEADEARRAELRTAAERAYEQGWFASTGPRLDMLGRAIDRAFDDALWQAELYRLGLLYYSGFLLAVLAFLLWNLDQRRRQIDRINAELRDANEFLEARVAERTRELSDALARLKESEAMLIQSEKMSSLGQMVAGIAHEVNTPLAYVKSSLEAVRRSLPQAGRLAAETDRLLALLAAEGGDEAALAAQFDLVRGLVAELGGAGGPPQAMGGLDKLVQDGLFGIGQISEIVANLKNFSRLDRSKVADFDLHEGIESSIRIGQAQLKGRTLRREFGKIPQVTCSPSQINQVILNLLVNAAQATRDGEGVITIRTALRDANHVAVEVADNGHGIPAEVLPKIFDPFFTTKGVGKGTGLGLSICYKIVEGHGGRLEVQTKPGVGTRFSMVLPIRPPAPAA